MVVLRLFGRNCPEPWPVRRSVSNQLFGYLMIFGIARLRLCGRRFMIAA